MADAKPRATVAAPAVRADAVDPRRVQAAMDTLAGDRMEGRLTGSRGGERAAEWLAARRDEVVLVTAHYDHLGIRAPVGCDSIWNGADDDASGTVALLEMAGALARGPRPAQRFFERSDNIGFARRGIPAHTISSYNLHREYHTPADEPATIDAAYMARVIEAATRALRLLADGTAPKWHPGGRP